MDEIRRLRPSSDSQVYYFKDQVYFRSSAVVKIRTSHTPKPMTADIKCDYQIMSLNDNCSDTKLDFHNIITTDSANRGFDIPCMIMMDLLVPVFSSMMCWSWYPKLKTTNYPKRNSPLLGRCCSNYPRVMHTSRFLSHLSHSERRRLARVRIPPRATTATTAVWG